MRTVVLSVLPLAALLSGAGASTVFLQQDEYIGDDFFAHWQWETFDDPTHGRTNYVDQNVARQNNLSFATSQKFVMRADATSIIPENARGRDSIRISSKASYDEALFVIDVAHMPTGCATWPAWWTVGTAGWPAGGEIDIIEGVNLGTENLASLHTSEGCTVPQDRSQTGTTISTDCDAAINSNQGCGTLFTSRGSAGYRSSAAQSENATETTSLTTASLSYTTTTPTTASNSSFWAAEAEEPTSFGFVESTPHTVNTTSASSSTKGPWWDSMNSAQTPVSVSQKRTYASSSAPTATSASVVSFFSVGAGGETEQPLAARADASSDSTPSFGAPFNEAGGGFYAMSKSRAGGINVWFWPRESESVPVEVRYGGAVAVPSVSWGIPAATFPLGDNCPYGDHFDAHKMVFDLTLCGDWAGSAWSSSSCGTGTCEDFVNNNPQAFDEAYWEINSVRVYEPASTNSW